MLALLPRERDGLPQLESRITPEFINEIIASMTVSEVYLCLPRFKTESAFKLNDTLSALGMSDAFDEFRANFAGMDGQPDNLYIAAVLHKAFIEVNEEGSEAAAATAVVMAKRAMPLTSTFRADHPFLFFIRERQSGSILFMGRVVNPSE